MIVVGASLGGVNAVRDLLSVLPMRFRAPIAIVLHRQRDSDGALLQLLQRGTHLPVGEPCDKDPILPGRVYVAPADYHLLLEPGYFSLSVDEPVQFARPSIDVLFESAAEVYGAGAIGVILTGANQDGALGAQALRRRGGIVVVQDPATAECPIMPSATVARAGADHVVALGAMGDLLGRLASQQEKGAA